MKKRGKILLALAGILLVLCVASIVYSAYGLKITEYTYVTQVSEDIRVVHITDLHCMEFGSRNQRLIRAVQDSDPDIIAMTGDMFSWDSTAEQVQRICQLVTQMDAIAPVYYSLGNHELSYMQEHGTEVLLALERAGAVVLEQTYEDVQIGTQTVRVGGAYGYLLSRDLRNTPEQDFMDAFLDTQHPTLLLAHMSEGLLAYNSIDHWDVDLVLSGHAHGGQIRLPFVGGLYDPEVGFFPEYTRGFFQRQDSAVVLSAGLGSSTVIPRFCNPPELIVVTITAQ